MMAIAEGVSPTLLYSTKRRKRRNAKIETSSKKCASMVHGGREEKTATF